MKVVWVVFFVVLLSSCSTLSPVYQFFAHKHSVPMIGADYVDIPEVSPSSSDIHDDRFHNAIDKASALLEESRKAISSPGISAAVAVDGKLVWSGTSGWADISANKPLTTSSQFRIGSTSKALNAVLLARMVDANNISLDVPLSAFDVGRLNDDWQQITPRQLASHMAGIPHYDKNTDWVGLYHSMALKKRYTNVLDAVSLFDSSRILSPPGEMFSYSSLGTVLLSAVMQEAANEPYLHIMEKQVLSPLKLTHTMMEPLPAEHKTKSPSISQFYWHPKKGGNRVAVWREVDLSHRLAGGGFISTSTDLVKLGIGFMAPNFVSTAVRDEFWTPQKLNNGEVNEQHYAIGWRVRESDFGGGLGKLFYVTHGGVSRGALSSLMVIPEYNMAIAVNINSKAEYARTFGKVAFDLARIFLEQRNELLNKQ
jgi:CubicO group peptidase (beta-lactamase class C family)